MRERHWQWSEFCGWGRGERERESGKSTGVCINDWIFTARLSLSAACSLQWQDLQKEGRRETIFPTIDLQWKTLSMHTIVGVGVHINSTGERVSKALQNSALVKAEATGDVCSCNLVLGSGDNDTLSWAQVDVDRPFCPSSSSSGLKRSTHCYICTIHQSNTTPLASLTLLHWTVELF